MTRSNRTPAEDAFRMGDHLARTGDVESARGAFLSGVSFGDPEWSLRSAATVGHLLQAALATGSLTAMRRLGADGAPRTVTDEDVDVATGRSARVERRFWTR